MAEDPSRTIYTVVLTGVRDKSSMTSVAHTLSNVSDRLPLELVMKRLKSLPWTLTRKATLKKAMRLVKLLESLGGKTQCIPPLPGATEFDASETQILPGTDLLSQTQVMSATQFIPVAEDPPPPSRERHRLPESTKLFAAAPAAASSKGPVAEENPPETAPQQETPSDGSSLAQRLAWSICAIILGAGLVLGTVIVADHFLPNFLR